MSEEELAERIFQLEKENRKLKEENSRLKRELELEALDDFTIYGLGVD